MKKRHADLPPCKGKREWWLRNRIDVLSAAYYLGLTAVGILGFSEPSVTMKATVGELGVIIWTTGMVVMGAIAAVTVFTQSRTAETRALATIALLTGIHGLILVFAPDGSGVQTGVRLLVATPFYFAFIYTRTDTAITTHQIRHQIQVAREVDRVNGAWRNGTLEDEGR